MVTDISVRTGGSVAEDRSWAIGEHGFDMPVNAPLAFATFTGANFADGVVKSGCVLGRVTATGAYGPYLGSASDGRETAVGVLFNTFRIPADTATVASDAALVHFHCRQARLPYTSGAGAIDAAGRADLPLVLWA